MGFQRATGRRVFWKIIGRRERIDVHAEDAPTREEPIGLANLKITAYHGRLLSVARPSRFSNAADEYETYEITLEHGRA